MCCSCSKKTTIENDELREAISQVWLDADVAHEMLKQIDINSINYYEQQHYRLVEAHLMLKRELRLPNGSDMDALAKYFESCGDEASAAEAYYIQGAYLNWLSENTRAMQYLKKAELFQEAFQ